MIQIWTRAGAIGIARGDTLTLEAQSTQASLAKAFWNVCGREMVVLKKGH